MRVITENIEKVTYLGWNHEEADTQIFLNTTDASQSKDVPVMTCEDNVFPIAIAKADIIGVPIYMKRCTQKRTWFVNINNTFASLRSANLRS